jgi:hypothetical protein
MFSVGKDEESSNNLHIDKFRQVLDEIVKMINNINSQKNPAMWKDLNNLDIRLGSI